MVHEVVKEAAMSTPKATIQGDGAGEATRSPAGPVAWGRVEKAEGVQGRPAAAAAPVGQYPSEVVGQRLHVLGAPGFLLGLERGVHPVVPSAASLGGGS